MLICLLFLWASSLERAIENIDSGRLADAESTLRQVLAAEPSSHKANYYLGVVLFRLGRPEDAVLPLSKAATLNPKDAATQSALGAAYAAQSLHELAEAPFRAACLLNPQEPDACYFSGRNLYALNRFGESLEALSKALAVDIRPARVHLGIAQSLEALGEMERAAAAFSAAIETNNKAGRNRKLRPDDDPRIAYSVFLLRQGNVAQSRRPAADAVAEHPESARARLQLARVLYQLEELEAAVTELVRTTALDPKSAPAHLLLGKAYGRMGRHDEARTHLAKAEALGLQ
jgi:Flp pilus assembly protein TadD